MSLNPFETPLNIALLLAIAYYTRQVVFPSASMPKTLPSEHSKGYNWMPASHPDVSVFKTYTPKTLEPFSGKDSGKILLAIDRKVFDVTAGRNFYGPGTYDLLWCLHELNVPEDGMYGNFAGRDASRGMAKQSFDVGEFSPIFRGYSIEISLQRCSRT
jgi:membrane-associated progesterone receptor component